MRDTVAVLLATYNGEEYLSEQLSSIERQSYQNWHLFISDDGSNDETNRLINEFQTKNRDRVTNLTPRIPCGGAKENFFYLMRSVPRCYEAYCLCDQDDVWDSRKIEKSRRKLMELENADSDSPCLVFCDARVVDSELSLISDSFFSYADVNPNATKIAELVVQNPISGAEIMLNGRALDLACRPVDLRGIDMHDQWIGLVVSAFGRIDHVDDQLFSYRQHGRNVVGAVPMGFRSIVRKARSASESLSRKQIQAQRLADTYRNELRQDQLELLEGFARIRTIPKAKRIRFMQKWGIRMNGLLRNSALYVYI